MGTAGVAPGRRREEQTEGHAPTSATRGRQDAKTIASRGFRGAQFRPSGAVATFFKNFQKIVAKKKKTRCNMAICMASFSQGTTMLARPRAKIMFTIGLLLIAAAVLKAHGLAIDPAGDGIARPPGQAHGGSKLEGAGRSSDA
jgi:hypothetical protein